MKKINMDKPTLIVELENFQMRKFGYDDSDIFSLIKDIGYVPFYLEYSYPSDHVFVHKSKIDDFLKKNKIEPLIIGNNLNNNIKNGVNNKIITNK